MKTFLLPALLFLVTASCNIPVAGGRNQAIFRNAVEYNDYIISRQQQVSRLVNDFVAATTAGSDSAAIILDRNTIEIAGFLDDIAAMSDFRGDSTFRRAAVQSFSFYKRIFKEEYPRLLAINGKGEGITPEDRHVADSITKALSEEESLLDRRFLRVQRTFARKNNMRLEDKKLAANGD